MAYNKHTWQCGEVLTPEAMNRIEQGIADAGTGGGVAMVDVAITREEGCEIFTASKTAAELYDIVVNQGRPIMGRTEVIGAHILLTPFSVVFHGSPSNPIAGFPCLLIQVSDPSANTFSVVTLSSSTWDAPPSGTKCY